MDEYPFPEKDADILMTVQRMAEMRRDDISEIEELQRNGGYERGFSKKPLGVTAAETVGAGYFFVDANASGGAFTVTLEAAPIDGQMHAIAKADASGNAVTVSGNGKNINGASTQVLSAQYDAITIIYSGSADEWRILASI